MRTAFELERNTQDDCQRLRASAFSITTYCGLRKYVSWLAQPQLFRDIEKLIRLILKHEVKLRSRYNIWEKGVGHYVHGGAACDTRTGITCHPWWSAKSPSKPRYFNIPSFPKILFISSLLRRNFSWTLTTKHSQWTIDVKHRSWADNLAALDCRIRSLKLFEHCGPQHRYEG